MSEDLGVGGRLKVVAVAGERLNVVLCGPLASHLGVFICKVNVRKWYGAAKKVCSRPRPRYFKCVRFAPY